MGTVRVSVLGLETEYGVHAHGLAAEAQPDPIWLSTQVIEALETRESTWDFADESPLKDARGYHLPRDGAFPDLLTDEVRHANRLMPNGARCYVDHAHPEHSGPEVSSAREAVVWDAAGDALMLGAAQRAGAREGLDVRLYRNTTDGKGHSYGCHENYLLARDVPFGDVVEQFTTHLVSRVVVTGAGRVGIGQRGEVAGFQLSQRADFFEALVGLETTIRRPIINTRDEPHADARLHRRLHVIPGDANSSQVQTFVKVGGAQLVLASIAAGRCHVPTLVDPLAALRTFSRDAACRVRVPCSDGVERTAVDLQRLFAEVVARDTDRTAVPDRDAVLDAWTTILDDLAHDPMRCADRLDWAAKLRLMEGLRVRHGFGWDAPQLAALDLAWADLDPDRGLFHRLVRRGDMASMVGDDEVARAMTAPPETTRAWLRGRILDRFPGQVLAASWDSVTLLLRGGRQVNLALRDPLWGTRAHVGEMLDRCTTADDLVVALAR